MAVRPLVPDFADVAVPMGAVLDQQVELLRAAHGSGDPVAAEVLRGTGTMAGTVEEILGAELTLETARLGLPLWTAITFGYTEAAEALVSCGARVDNLIFHAALGNLPAVRVYFGAGGVLDPVRARGSLRVSAVGPGAPLLEYALIEAAAHGRREVVEFLLRQGPDLNVTEPVFGATARGAARHLGYPEIAALL